MLVLSLKRSITIPLELATVTPQGLRDLSLSQVCETRIRLGREQLSLGDLFDVEGSPEEDQIRFVGDFSVTIGLGMQMSSGKIVVEGNAGRNTGWGMSGGELEITGSAADGLGSEMRGGTIKVRGSAGDFVGGSVVGSSIGMTGGTILIEGGVGAYAGCRMRRGLIAVKKNAGDYLGYNMLAGTIVVLGDVGKYLGAEMKRGTICIASSASNQLLPTFRYACDSPSPALGLVGRHLQTVGLENDVGNANRKWRQYSGDFLSGGRGEVFLAGR